MFLFLDRATGAETIVAFLDKNYSVQSMRARHTIRRSSHVLLADVFFLLKKEKKTLKDIRGVIVIYGEGKFTALRTAVILANTLAWTLRIPLSGVVTDEHRPKTRKALQEFIHMHARRARRCPARRGFFLPQYGKEPNITYQTRMQ